MNKPLVLTISAVVSGAIMIGSVLLLVTVDSKPTSTEVCKTKGKTHTVLISNDTVKPTVTKAKLCDSITIKNTDTETRKIGFGNHDHHQEFSGVEEKILRGDESFTLLLTESGTIGFHDHYNHDTEGTLIVAK